MHQNAGCDICALFDKSSPHICELQTSAHFVPNSHECPISGRAGASDRVGGEFAQCPGVQTQVRHKMASLRLLKMFVTVCLQVRR